MLSLSISRQNIHPVSKAGFLLLTRMGDKQPRINPSEGGGLIQQDARLCEYSRREPLNPHLRCQATVFLIPSTPLDRWALGRDVLLIKRCKKHPLLNLVMWLLKSLLVAHQPRIVKFIQMYPRHFKSKTRILA